MGSDESMDDLFLNQTRYRRFAGTSYEVSVLHFSAAGSLAHYLEYIISRKNFMSP
jgi:hypothetical protein